MYAIHLTFLLLSSSQIYAIHLTVLLLGLFFFLNYKKYVIVCTALVRGFATPVERVLCLCVCRRPAEKPSSKRSSRGVYFSFQLHRRRLTGHAVLTAWHLVRVHGFSAVRRPDQQNDDNNLMCTRACIIGRAERKKKRRRRRFVIRTVCTHNGNIIVADIPRLLSSADKTIAYN